MSEIAGRIAAQVGASSSPRRRAGGACSWEASRRPARKVVVIGGGVAGENAAAVAVGMGARVMVLDRCRTASATPVTFGSRVTTLFSTAGDRRRIPTPISWSGPCSSRGARAACLCAGQHLRR